MNVSTDRHQSAGSPPASCLAVLMALAAGASAGAVGCNDCDFWAHCDGNVRVVCGAGVDQQVGRKVQRIPCEAPNPICVAGTQEAVCVRSADARCPFPSPRRCEGNKQISCEGVAGAGMVDGGSGPDNRGYEVELDCASVKDPSSGASVSPWICVAPTGCAARVQ